MQAPAPAEGGGHSNHHESFVSEVTCEEGTHSPYMNSPITTSRSVSVQITFFMTWVQR